MYNDISLVRLFSDASQVVIDHICSLEKDDLYLRFGYTPSKTHIENYVNKSMSTVNTQFEGDYWFGIINSEKLVATIHISVKDSVAEFAFSTDKNHRGKKLGQLLFARGYQLITEMKIDRIYMCMLSQNAPMKHIAKKFGMSVMTFGTDSEASVNITYPVPLNRVNEVRMSMIDKNIFTEVGK